MVGTIRNRDILIQAKNELKKTYTNRLSSISKIRESDRFGILANNFLFYVGILMRLIFQNVISKTGI